jgi:hypothetical protein
MMKEADLNGDSDIDFGEFLVLMHRSRRQGKSTEFASLADKVEAKVNFQPGAGVIYAFLTLTFLVLISTSTTLFHFFKYDGN